ncbi:MAG: bifunctional hydroxymethylpyrimidine kinase/phosphomethylpyrimidine kinase [Lachnospiraceae bacterium]|nr:bifunctional hydroxymethylpyrimidine kinase/phosphomethylpyrimidine kinase [Lachnospiraceae bacterium]
MYTALTIAGSDSSGGAGIQADIKTMTAHGIYAMSAITALTAQNTTGVYDILEVSPEFLAKQLDCIFTDIFPDAVKTGMVASAKLIEVIADKLSFYHTRRLIVDPVMVSTSGSRLISEEAIHTLTTRLFPLATLITPNIPEASTLTGRSIHTADDMISAARSLQERFGCAVLLKGGHQTNTANDLLYENGSATWFFGKRIDNPNTHGTGCTLSSAIACNLAAGMDLSASISHAKNYLSGALKAGLNLGAGSGPLNHAYRIDPSQAKPDTPYTFTDTTQITNHHIHQNNSGGTT